MALEQDFDEGLINETVQVQDSRETAPRHPADTQTPEAAEASATETVSNLMSFMPSIADQFMQSVDAATRKLADRVEDAQSLTPHEIKAAKESFVGAMLEAAGQLMAQREWLVDEIRSFDGLWQGQVLRKIKETEAAVEAEELRIRAMTDEDSVDLSSVMRSITALNEKKAYLKGLKIQIPNNID